MQKYVKLSDLEYLLRRMLQEPRYQHCGEDWYCGIAAVYSEINNLPVILSEREDYTIEDQ